jgi:hypothetical protein
MIDSGVISQHALEMAPRAGLVAQIMLRGADQVLADRPITRVGPARSQSMESLSQCESNAIPTAGGVKDP